MTIKEELKFGLNCFVCMWMGHIPTRETLDLLFERQGKDGKLQGSAVYQSEFNLSQYVKFNDNGAPKEFGKEPYWEHVVDKNMDLCEKCYQAILKKNTLEEKNNDSWEGDPDEFTPSMKKTIEQLRDYKKRRGKKKR